MLMAQEEFGGFGELAAFLVAAFFLDFTELIDCLLKLTGEARAVQSERGELGD